jgi:uncharacterized protein (TIGR03084 family)
VADLGTVLPDLRAESADLDTLVAGLTPDDWARATPAPGWTIAHQVAHLIWADELATGAATDPDAFTAALPELLADLDHQVDRAANQLAGRPPVELLATWRDNRERLATALSQVPEGIRLPWFGPPMTATSMATARLMETWAHGQDVTDTLGVSRVPTDRLRHVAHLGVRTRDFAYAVRGRPAPAEAFRIELAGPSGDLWAWGPTGPADAAQHVTGPALDFCLLVTQRRHRADLRLVAIGPDADAWLDIAQAFAGPSGPGRMPGQFRASAP